MEARKWEELPIDCLVDVFGRVELESLVADVPLVCKSWYKATRSPFCWKELDFPAVFKRSGPGGVSLPDDINDMSWILDSFAIRHKQKTYATNFLKLVVDCSGGSAIMVKLPPIYTKEALTYLADKCPVLKKLTLLDGILESLLIPLSFVIGKFKNLESLEIESDIRFKDIVTKIGAHCENFVALSLVYGGISEVHIGEEEVKTIVTCLPKIKCLALRYVFLDRENLIRILKGCLELEHLDVSNCWMKKMRNCQSLLPISPHLIALVLVLLIHLMMTVTIILVYYDYQLILIEFDYVSLCKFIF